MAKLIRGRIIVDAKETKDNAPMAGVSLTPLDLSDPEDYDDDLDDEDYEETELLPERDGATFATAVAPWVGAEKVWRNDTLLSAHPRHAQQKDNRREQDMTPLELEISESEAPTAHSTVSPPKQRSRGKQHMLRLLSYLAVAAISVVSTWMITRMDEKPVESQKTVPLTTAKSRHVGDSTIVAQDDSDCFGDNDHASYRVKPEQDNSRESVKTTIALAEDEENEAISSDKSAIRSNDKRHSTKSAGRRRIVRPEKASEADEKKVPTTAALSADAAAVESKNSPAVDKESKAGMIDVNAIEKIEHREVGSEDKPDRTVQNPDEDYSMSSPKQSLSKAQVKQTMKSIAPEIQKCRNGVSGRVVVELVVAGSTGRVTSARAIDQVAVGATAGKCAAQAVQLLKFPTFEKSQLTIIYPFDLK